MTEAISPTIKKPGVVIFVSILNFVSSAVWFFSLLLTFLLLVFGHSIQFFEKSITQFSQNLSTAGIGIGLSVILSVFMVFFGLMLLFHLFLGIGLLKGKSLAWYVQLVSGTFGLVFLPYGTLISVIILIFFFQSSVRNYFKV